VRGYARPAIRCNPARAVGPRASSDPAPAAASQGRPPPGTVSDPPWFPHPSPFVWLFCKTRSKIVTISNSNVAAGFGSTQASQAKSRGCNRTRIIWRQHCTAPFMYIYVSYAELISKLIDLERCFLINSYHRRNSRKVYRKKKADRSNRSRL